MKNVSPKMSLNVAEHIAPVIGSRDVLNVLREKIEKAETQPVVLDFTDVEFISRSAAHALLKLQEDLLNTEFVNTNQAVSDMLEIVAKSKTQPKKSNANFHPRRVDFDMLLSQELV